MTRGVAIDVQPKPLTSEQKQWLEQAWAQIDHDEIISLVVNMVNIVSLPGRERELAQFMVSWMNSIRLDAFYQRIDENQGNAIGVLRGSGGGPDLLLWGELDMLWGIEGEDRLGMGDLSRPELKPEAKIEGDYIIGLGAGNPKGHTACAAMAVRAIKNANIPLKGNVILGFPGGGMSTNAWDANNPRQNVAHGIGCEFMLQQGIYPDFAIAAKPVYAVSWEEAGFCWFKVSVKGSLGYAGTRHLLPYNNAIVNAAKVIEGLEKWFPEYARRNASGIIAPQGIIGAIEGGCSYKPLIFPEMCNMYLDVRINPDMQPTDAKRQLEEALHHIQAQNPGLELDYEMILAIPGSRTDPQNWIVQSCIRAWEYVEGRKHVYDTFHSGATDVNILRAWGVPVARLGVPLYDLPAGLKPDLATGMSTLRVEDTKRLIKCFIYSIIDTCTRSVDEVGLSRN
jgi:acetylornithine deacetylase/succinyl-diaminopimelate desuccinylase-like protein